MLTRFSIVYHRHHYHYVIIRPILVFFFVQFFECLMKRSVSPVCIELEVVNLFCRYGFVFLFARCPYFMVFCF